MLRRRAISDLLRPERRSLRTLLVCMRCGCGPAKPLAVLPGMSQSGPHALSQDLALELSEDGQQRGHRATGRRGQVQRLGQRYEADAEMFQFLQRGEQVGYRSSPAIQPPHQHHIDLPAPRSFHQLLPQLPLGCTGADFFHLHGDGPATPGGILAHGAVLHGQCLLILSGDSGIEAGADRFGDFSAPGQKPSRIF